MVWLYPGAKYSQCVPQEYGAAERDVVIILLEARVVYVCFRQAGMRFLCIYIPIEAQPFFMQSAKRLRRFTAGVALCGGGFKRFIYCKRKRLYDLLLGLDKAFFDRAEFRHGEGNSAAHLKASAMGSSTTVIIEDGRLVLGTWQGIYFCEFDPPRSRKFYVKVMEE